MSASEIMTPCVKVCVVDPISALCVGCGRTLAEIAAWGGMSEPERATIMAGLSERLHGSRSRIERGGRVSDRERAR